MAVVRTILKWTPELGIGWQNFLERVGSMAVDYSKLTITGEFNDPTTKIDQVIEVEITKPAKPRIVANNS